MEEMENDNEQTKATRKLGAKEWQVKTCSNTRKSYARCASSFLYVVITNNLLKRKGLPLLVDQY